MKTCSKCETPRLPAEFRDGRARHCVSCTDAAKEARTLYMRVFRSRWAEEIKTYSKKYWAEHQEGRKLYMGEYRTLNKKKLGIKSYEHQSKVKTFIRSLKADSCLDCGEKFPSFCMEFDHLREKKHGVSTMRSFSRKAILAEIAKCELVCANCHRVRSKMRRDGKTIRNNPAFRAWQTWLNVLKSSACGDCGRTFHPAAMDFDHVRGAKLKGISQMWTQPRELVLAEMEKCDLVCACCHRVRTENRRPPGSSRGGREAELLMLEQV